MSERSVAGKRIREFDADTIHAFARAFGLPVGFFFMPPDAETVVGLEGASFHAAKFPEQVTLTSVVVDEMRDRIDELTRQVPATDRIRLLRSLHKGPGGLSENALLLAAVERMRKELDTLTALARDTD